MSKFDQLIEFLVSLPALFVLLVGLFAFFQALKYNKIRWAIFGVTMYVASMSKFYDEYEERFWDSFNYPIETLVVNGRPFAVLMLMLLISVAVFTNASSMRFRIPAMMGPIHAMQCLVLFKVFDGNGFSSYVMQAALIFIFIALVTGFGLRQWIAQGNAADMFAFALVITGVVFVSIVGWHLVTNPVAIIRQGRLMGTTGNPQHAAVLLGLTFLGPAYIFATFRDRKKWVVLASLGLAIATLYLLLLTGSRTGVGLIVIGTLVLFRGRLRSTALMGVIAASTLFLVVQQFGDQVDVERLASVEDTRSDVWSSQWETFKRHPIFGAPQRGSQFRSAENSWLGLLAAAGAFGGVCLTWLLYEYGRTARALWALRKRPELSLQVNFCLAGIATVLAGSFFEAYLFGIITFPVLFIAALSVVCEHTINSAYAIPGNSLANWQQPQQGMFYRRNFEQG